LFDRIYPHGITFGVQYNPVWYSQNVRAASDRAGLDVSGVREIFIGARRFARARERWSNLLAPHPQVDEGAWQIGTDGPILRLRPHHRSGLLGMALGVHSLNRAAQFLYRRGIPTTEKSGFLVIEPKKMFGLRIRITQ
jgi:hypothetical protein